MIRLFEGFGVEMEWMIVDATTLDIRPVADLILGPEGELERGDMAWSNELVLHVLEAKTNGPAPVLGGLGRAFHTEALEAERLLAAHGCRLMGGAAHPWMAPDRETRIWPHEYTEVYRAFDRIFGVRGHGWANLQSTHLNLPFADDVEFGRLHRAVRMVLPLIPAVAAASPVLDGTIQPNLDERMERYRLNARRIPSVSGGVVPDAMATRLAYEEAVLGPIFADMAVLDPEGVLRHEWVNARGAIARFERGAIEIRVVDAQEAPSMDIAILALVVEAVRRLVESLGDDAPPSDDLRALLAQTVFVAERAVLPEAVRGPLCDALGVEGAGPREVGELWEAFADSVGREAGEPLGPWAAELEVLFGEGPLARRLMRALETGRAPLRAGEVVPRGRLREVWVRMADALSADRPFVP